MTPRTLTRRVLNRTLLARQGLLERSGATIPDLLDQVGGLQTQYAPSGYVGLWTRLRGFRRAALTDALEDRSVVQATLMRVTIHLVSRDAYWRYALGVRQARRIMALRTQPALTGRTEASMREDAERLRAALDDGPRTVRELGSLGSGFVGNLGLWVDLVRVPPSGTWERRRADRLALADAWVGPEDGTEEDGRAHLTRAYLRAFGPAAWRDIASWSGVAANELRAAARERIPLVHYLDDAGGELVDMEGLALADPDVPAPVRFLPHWDANLLVHARRTGLLPEPYRRRVFSTRNPFSVGTYLVDGSVAGAWSLRDGRVELDPFGSLDSSDRADVEREREALEAFHA